MATVTEYDAASVASTTDGATRVSNSFTPNADEVLVVTVVAGGTVSAAPTLTSSANGISFALVDRGEFNSLNSVYQFVAKRHTPASPSAMTLTFTAVGDNHSGAMMFVAGIAGMERVGLDAVRQHSVITNGPGASVPDFPDLGSNVLTGNVTLYSLGEISTGGILTPTGWTEGGEDSFTTPTVGGGYGYRTSGFTGLSPTWPGNETAHGGIFTEFDTSPADDIRVEVERTNSSAGSYGNWKWEVTFTEDVEVTRFLYFARLARTYTVTFNGTSIGSQAAGPDSDVDITLGTPFFVASGATLTIEITPDSGSSIYFVSGTSPILTGSGADKVSFWGNFRAPSSGGTANNSHGVLVWQTPSSAPSGSGAGTFTFTGAGSGSRTSSGSGTGSVAFTGAGSGTRVSSGSGTGAFAFTGAGSGQSQRTGTGAAGAVTFTGTGAGTVTKTGSATSGWGFTGTGTGATAKAGTGTSGYTFTGTGAGTAPAEDVSAGGGTGTFAFTGTGTGSRTSAGTSAGTFTFSGSGSGLIAASGTGTGAYALAGSGTGTRASAGAGASVFEFTGAGAGPAEAAGDVTATASLTRPWTAQLVTATRTATLLRTRTAQATPPARSADVSRPRKASLTDG